MSTKIYTGFEVIGHTLETLMPELQALRGRFEARATELSAQWLVRRATALHDRAHFGLPAAWRDPVATLYRGMSYLGAAGEEEFTRHRAILAQRKRDPAVDVSGELVLIPHAGRLLGMSFIERPELEALWAAMPWRRDYAYWNNTDPPDEVSEAEWDRRRDDWDAVFEHSPVPAQCGFVYSLLELESFVPHPLEDSLLESCLPDTETRTRGLALEVYLQEHPQPAVVEADQGRLSAMVRALREVEASEAFVAWRRHFEERLPPLGLAQLHTAVPDEFIAQGQTVARA